MEDQDERLVDLEVDDRKDEGQREWKALPQPLAQERGLESPADDGDPLQGQHDREVSAAEPVLSGVCPDVVADALVRQTSVQDEGKEHDALEHDRDRLETQLLDRVETVAQQRRVRSQDHEHEAGDDEVAEADRIDEDRQHEQGDDRHEKPERHHVAQVALDLVAVTRPFADEQDVESEVQGDAGDRGQVDERREDAVIVSAQLADHVEDGEESDQARDDLCGQDDGRVAERPRPQAQAGGRRFQWCVVG